MAAALAQARDAAAWGDVPVGAVIVCGDGTVPEDGIVARGANRRQIDDDPLAHAEMVALRAAAAALDGWRLDDATLVVTLEPCAMCAGAIAQARVKRLVFGAFDPKAGAVSSVFDVLRDPRLPHRVDVVAGVMADECQALLTGFFAGRRTPQHSSQQSGSWGRVDERSHWLKTLRRPA